MLFNKLGERPKKYSPVELPVYCLMITSFQDLVTCESFESSTFSSRLIAGVMLGHWFRSGWVSVWPSVFPMLWAFCKRLGFCQSAVEQPDLP